MNKERFIKMLTEGMDITHWSGPAHMQFCDILMQEMCIPEDDIWIEDQSDGKKAKFLLIKGKFSLLYLEVMDDLLLFTVFDRFTMDMHIKDVASIIDAAMCVILQFDVSETFSLQNEGPKKISTPPKKDIQEYYLSKINSSMVNKIDYNKINKINRINKKDLK